MALADDIARSMSVISCRVAVAQGRNAIGIEMPNSKRETVYLRDLLSSADYEKASQILPMALGETIGGEPYIADLAKMPHLLIAGTTGSGKSVGVNAMILSILYKLPPDKCRFIMIDPKMLELSVYDGIPHLLAPVVTDPKKAVGRPEVDRPRDGGPLSPHVEDRLVRNIGGYNEKANEALDKGEHFERTVQTGFDDAGRPIYETEQIRPEAMPYLVVVIDEVADLMMVAGKDIEGAVQRLAQMARAAGIHLIMATQRPSVDVITGTIKANFPTRISFQVTSKIDARTILGEQGAEQLLGQGDMLYMAGGGRITRLHGPFVSDGEVEQVAKFLRDQGIPQYLEEVTAGGDEEQEEAIEGAFAGEGGSNDLYDPRRGRGHPRPQGLDQLHPAPPADRLQPRRLADGADGEGRRRRRRQPRRQARDPGPAATADVISTPLSPAKAGVQIEPRAPLRRASAEGASTSDAQDESGPGFRRGERDEGKPWPFGRVPSIPT